MTEQGTKFFSAPNCLEFLGENSKLTPAHDHQVPKTIGMYASFGFFEPQSPSFPTFLQAILLSLH